MPGRALLAALATALMLALAACGEAGAGSPAITVVATTTQAGALARSVGGDRVEVEQLLAPNSDPHEYEVRPQDVKALAGAPLVIRSGGDVDEWLGGAIESAGADPRVVTLIDAVAAAPGGHAHAGEDLHDEEVDPHWWQDPRNAVLAVGAIERALAKADPDGATGYRARAGEYGAALRDLDRAVAACWARVPRRQRKLVTTHDALGYYARRYGVEVIGAVIPSLSTRGQASAGDTAELVELIRRARVRAVFTEHSVDAKLERAIAAESGARVGRPLWTDALGPAGSDGATYEGSIASNTRSLVDGVTGEPGSCSLPA